MNKPKAKFEVADKSSWYAKKIYDYKWMNISPETKSMNIINSKTSIKGTNKSPQTSSLYGHSTPKTLSNNEY